MLSSSHFILFSIQEDMNILTAAQKSDIYDLGVQNAA
jgi:hypothetical protein